MSANSTKRPIPGRKRMRVSAPKIPMSAVMRKRQVIADAIQMSRYHNYEFHMNNRKWFLNFSAEYLGKLDVGVEGLVAMPTIDLFGAAPSPTEFVCDTLVAELKKYENLLFFLNRWYWTEEGWEHFQILWKELPEPEELWVSEPLSVDNLLITCGQVVKNCGQTVDKKHGFKKELGNFYSLFHRLWISTQVTHR